MLTFGSCWRHPLGDDEHVVALDIRTLQLVVLVQQGRVPLKEYLDQHPDRLEAVRQAIRDAAKGQ
jgi:hypothetical protein